MKRRRIIVGISGASGFQYGMKALEILRDIDIDVHLIISKGAEVTRSLETDIGRQDVIRLADDVHSINNLGASVSSGSFKTIGMIIAPCSMNTLGSVAHGLTSNLLTRAADVVLKERRRLVLMVRETPLNLSHLKNMQAVTEMGGIIFPPMPAFYLRPKSIDDIVDHTVMRVLELFDIQVPGERWDGSQKPS